MSVPHLPKRNSLHRSRRFTARFRRNTAAEFMPGNCLTLLHNGSDFFTELFETIATAKASLCLEFYTVRNDRVGRRMADALAAAVARGVTVHFLYDYFGCIDTPDSYFRVLMARGVYCRAFNPPSWRKGLGWFDRRDHRKIVVVDDRIAFVGSLNIGDEYAGSDDGGLLWRDVGMRLAGPAAQTLRGLFDENWQEATAERPRLPEPVPSLACEGTDTVAIVSGSPHHNRSHIRAAFQLGLAGAGSRVCIETPYFVPDPRFLRALLRAAKRGVHVQLILPAHSDIALVPLVNRSFYTPLLKGEVEIYERQGTILHAKVMVIDAAWSVIGSANLDQRSFHRNYEVSVIVASDDFGRQVESLLDNELTCSRQVTLAEHEQRGLLVRLFERLTAVIGWFL